MRKKWVYGQIVNNIQLAKMLRTYRICNSMMGFSKYEFYIKLLGSIILLRVIPGVTWIQSSICS